MPPNIFIRPKPFIKVFNSLSIFIVITIILIAALSMRSLNHFYLGGKVNELQNSAETIASKISRNETESNFDELKKYADILSAHISIISRDGTQLVSTKPKTHSRVFDYSFFPDVRAALNGTTQWFESSDYHESVPKFFVSVPIMSEGKVKHVLRLEKETKGLYFDLNSAYAAILAVSGVALLSFFVYTGFINRKISSSISKLVDSVRNYADGNLKTKLYYEEHDIEEPLALELNKMSGQIDETLHSVVSQRNELEAVFTGMREGVLLIGADEKVIKINKAALEMLGTSNTEVEGKSIEEVVRNIHLQNYIRGVLKNSSFEEVELHFHEKKEMFVQVYTSLIPDLARERSVLMVVLNDITAIKQLEMVRKDFVANVSHELKTPITSIQGFVETLLDGAMYNPDENKRFLEIIRRQTERLNSIFNDLLILARLEKESGSRAAQLEPCDLRTLVDSVIQVCHVEAAKKQVTFDTQALKIGTVLANASLLEQALVNLVGNAIKFSSSGKQIQIISEIEGGMVKISVVDSGLGIDHVHLSRIFERFYRVDQARTREEGGTGLGLSIVKHIALAHQGSVDVESTVGKGSKFSLLIPCNTHY